jgi:hypothetical protein
MNVKKWRTIILFVLLYGCETRSLALREEYRRKILENKKIKGSLYRPLRPKRE